MKKAFTILVFVIGLVAVSIAQQAVITGRVLDQNEKILPGANIFIDEIGKGAVAQTTSVPNSDYAADDTAIWINYDAPEESLIIGSNKQRCPVSNPVFMVT